MKSKDNNKRRQKVYYQNFNYNGGNNLPHIRIAGKFLKAFDFNVGDSIELNLEKGKIIITKSLDEIQHTTEQDVARMEEINNLRKKKVQKDKGLQR